MELPRSQSSHKTAVAELTLARREYEELEKGLEILRELILANDVQIGGVRCKGPRRGVPPAIKSCLPVLNAAGWIMGRGISWDRPEIRLKIAGCIVEIGRASCGERRWQDV